MKFHLNTINLFIVFLSFCSCTKKISPRVIESVQIQEFKIDSTSIRAIISLDIDKVAYAGSNGEIGFFWEMEKPKPVYFLKHQDSIKPHFRSLAFNGTDYFALSIGNPALLFRISEGEYSLVYKEENEKVFYDSMKFFDEKNGIAIGDPTEDCLSIILTNDKGNTWMKVPCENLPKITEGEAAFAASNTNIKVLRKTAWIATGGTKANVYKSTDLGKTWQVFKTPIIQGTGSRGIYSIDFANEKNGIVIGGDFSKPNENKSNVAITNDGGKTWKLVADGIYPNYKSCVQYVPNTQGKEIFAVGKTGIAFSNDSGYTWKHVSDYEFYTIQFANKNTAWLSGNKKIGKLTLE